VVSKETGEHYTWGAGCDGWHLVKHLDLSVIHERMPPGTAEERHYHQAARQFFFVLSGRARLEIAGTRTPLGAQQGVEVPPGVPHQIFNESDQPVEFLVISQPTTRGDRVLVEAER
jgi:mannose-6-phosphate isomerase-like protein (cupin superfamily)